MCSTPLQHSNRTRLDALQPALNSRRPAEPAHATPFVVPGSCLLFKGNAGNAGNAPCIGPKYSMNYPKLRLSGGALPALLRYRPTSTMPAGARVRARFYRTASSSPLVTAAMIADAVSIDPWGRAFCASRRKASLFLIATQ